MDRDWLWALAGIGWACWTMGGAGQKWIRRFLWPGVLASLAIRYGVWWIPTCVSSVCLCLAHSFGYSPQRTSGAWRVGIGLWYGYALLPILWPHVWLGLVSGLLTSLVFNGGMVVSLRVPWITWKWVEGSVGAAQGGLVAWRLLHP